MSKGIVCDNCGAALALDERGDDEQGENAAWITIGTTFQRFDACTVSCAEQLLAGPVREAADRALEAADRAPRGPGDGPMTPTTPTPGAEPHQPGETCAACGHPITGHRANGCEHDWVGQSTMPCGCDDQDVRVVHMVPAVDDKQPGERERLAQVIWMAEARYDEISEACAVDTWEYLSETDREPWYVVADAVLAHLAERRAGDGDAVAKVLGRHSLWRDYAAGHLLSVRCRAPECADLRLPVDDEVAARHQAAQIAALTPTRGVSAETHTEWGVRIEGRQEVVSAHHNSREKAERGAATWVAQGDGRTAQIVRREVTDWREVDQ